MLIIGHRGAAGYEPENTLLSFRKAIELKAEMIEFDLRLCQTGEPVVIHDDSLERTTNGKGLVSVITLTDLQQLDAGKGQKIPTLEAVFETIGKQVKINIELKERLTAGPACELINRFVERGKIRMEDLLVSSFRIEELRQFRRRLPQIKTAPLFESLPEDFMEIASDLEAFSVHLELEHLTKAAVDKVQAAGYKVFVYTVNSPADKKRMHAWGVDGIFTDFP